MIGVGLFQAKNPNYRAQVGMRADFKPNGLTVAAGEIVAVGRTGFTVHITFTVSDVYKTGRNYPIAMNNTNWRVVRGDA